jgi:membrane protease subunit HflC
MIAERSRITQKYLSEGEGEYQRIMGEKNRALMNITSEAYKNAEQIKGKADAEATKIYALTYSLDPEFYAFQKSLEVMKDNAKGTTLVLDSNNKLFQYITKGDRK